MDYSAAVDRVTRDGGASIDDLMAFFWRWLYPDGRYPTASPRAQRMLQIVQALGADGVVHPDRDPARYCPTTTA